MKDNTNENNTMITSDSSKALNLLVDFVTKTNSNNKEFQKNNNSIIKKYSELVNNSAKYTPEEKEKIKKVIASRKINQLNAEDLAKYANNLEKGAKYLLEEREEKEI